MARVKLTAEIKAFLDGLLKGSKSIDYTRIAKLVAQKYGVRISKSSISKRAEALNLRFPRGRKQLSPVGKRPAHSLFLDCAGAFFLKGAELENGFLSTINRQIEAKSESHRARKALNLARQINALLLYAPVFSLHSIGDIVSYQRRGLLYLSEQKSMPGQAEIKQYLRYLSEQKLLPLIIKEVTEVIPEALLLRLDFDRETFYIDAQCRTVWPNRKVPQSFSASLYKIRGYVKDIFAEPSAQQPLILQSVPGYTSLPPEMLNMIRCFEEASKRPISRLAIMNKAGEILQDWQDIRPGKKCFFIAPLSPWQYERLRSIQILRDFQRYRLGPAGETMEVADAEVDLQTPQPPESIKVRAILVRRKEERLALITNIPQREVRYARKIAEQYFSRWPAEKVPTYYDLLEQGHQEVLSRTRKTNSLSPLLTMGYGKGPTQVFKCFLEHLHYYALSHFFPSENAGTDLETMRQRYYQQGGYLKIKQDCWEIILLPFAQENLQKDAQIACQRFNQNWIKFPSQKHLRISLQYNK